MDISVFRSKYPAIIYVLKGLSHVPFKMDTHNVHANRIWLPVSARAVGNAPVGSNSSGPAVIPSVSEGGTMVGERSMRKTPQASSFGGRWRIQIVVRNMPNRRGGGRSWWWDGLWIMWVSTKGVHIGGFQGDGRILKRFAVPPCMLEEYRMIWARPFW